MADYRNVHTKIWTDEWFLDLPPEGKLLWIYLFSNKRACLSGLYDIPMRLIVFETGITKEAITDLLLRFKNDGKAFYEDGWMLVPNLMKYNANNITNPKILGNIRADILSAPNIPLKRLWLQHFNAALPPERRQCAMTESDIGYSSIPDTVSDTVSDTHSGIEEDHIISDQSNQSEDKGAIAPPILPSSFESWLLALKSPASIGETNGIAVLTRMGEALYPHWPPGAYGRVGKLAKIAGSQSKLAQALWENASKPLAAPLDYLTSAVAGKARADPPPKPRKTYTVEEDA